MQRKKCTNFIALIDQGFLKKFVENTSQNRFTFKIHIQCSELTSRKKKEKKEVWDTYTHKEEEERGGKGT